MHIRIHRRGPTIHLLGYFDYQRALEAGEIAAFENDQWNDNRARNLISEHFRDSHEIARLRDALAPQLHGLTRSTDQFIIDAAVRCLQQGVWCVGYDRTALDTPAVSARPEASASGAHRRPDDSAVRDRRPTVRREPAPAATRSVPIESRAVELPPDPEWTDDIDQIAFADVLERAAREKYPFCEVCAAASAERARATQ